MAQFGKNSKNKLTEVHPDLVKVCNRALEIASSLNKDFSIIEGYRSAERQQDLFETGFSTIKNGGKHNCKPSLAIDFAPYHAKHGALTGNPTQTRELAKLTSRAYDLVNTIILGEFMIIATCFQLAAKELGVVITWGGDWNNDGNLFDTSFYDWGHIELGGK